MKFAIVAALAVALSGCVQSVNITTPFNPAEHAYAAQAGRATVAGQAFMRRNDGIVVYAAGSPVLLLPYTSYTREIFAAAGNTYGNVQFENGDQRLRDYSKMTQANGEGRFTFSGIPDGQYYLITRVTWMAGDWQQGGDLTQVVTVSNGQSVDVILTR
jgi:hypothetical protein